MYIEIKSCAIIGAPFGWGDSCTCTYVSTYVQLSYSRSRAGICVCVRRIRGILEGLQTLGPLLNHGPKVGPAFGVYWTHFCSKYPPPKTRLPISCRSVNRDFGWR